MEDLEEVWTLNDSPSVLDWGLWAVCDQLNADKKVSPVSWRVMFVSEDSTWSWRWDTKRLRLRRRCSGSHPNRLLGKNSRTCSASARYDHGAAEPDRPQNLRVRGPLRYSRRTWNDRPLPAFHQIGKFLLFCNIAHFSPPVNLRPNVSCFSKSVFISPPLFSLCPKMCGNALLCLSLFLSHRIYLLKMFIFILDSVSLLMWGRKLMLKLSNSFPL